ncbi:hypothetical protein BJF93_03565 [Xaviernesmea oryzae]|uniref:Uncharacterized protein n=1 Tax=Xaviernesmea oryzae TaxID=464029 RepID=A0A1Q9AU87_9HYPH|nr:hypothetical protein [Xaviernesmea oryzae]OLP59019.1 hypothetical protein BJF93_03565 [Xaviernesmea oryzae]SEK90378.1 Membrane protein involved in the export of O-antigen and teichoic acid [Xaviernesmea oryzae]
MRHGLRSLWHSGVRTARRFSGILSSMVYSGSNFLLIFLLQNETSRLEFGIFALSQVFLQLGISVCNALFATPILIYATDRAGWRENFGSFSKANWIFSTLFGGASALIAYQIGGGLLFSVLFFALSAISFIRWFIRSAELAQENYDLAVLADIAYGVLVAGGIGLLFLLNRIDNVSVTVVQIVGCLAAFPLLAQASRMSLTTLGSASFRPYLKSLREHGRWVLLGVLTTEATANAHSYLVGFLLGPVAYAPIAAVTLFYRPVNIVIQAMTQYERPRMAHAIAEGNTRELTRFVNIFRLMSLVVCAFNALLLASILWLLPDIIGNGAYDHNELVLAASLLAAINLARALRGSESAALQAGGHFRPLAMVTVYTSPISLIGTALIVLVFPTADAALSLIGVAAGEIGMYYLYYLLYRRTFWRKDAATTASG